MTRFLQLIMIRIDKCQKIKRFPMMFFNTCENLKDTLHKRPMVRVNRCFPPSNVETTFLSPSKHFENKIRFPTHIYETTHLTLLKI